MMISSDRKKYRQLGSIFPSSLHLCLMRGQVGWTGGRAVDRFVIKRYFQSYADRPTLFAPISSLEWKCIGKTWLFRGINVNIVALFALFKHDCSVFILGKRFFPSFSRNSRSFSFSFSFLFYDACSCFHTFTSTRLLQQKAGQCAKREKLQKKKTLLLFFANAIFSQGDFFSFPWRIEYEKGTGSGSISFFFPYTRSFAKKNRPRKGSCPQKGFRIALLW